MNRIKIIFPIVALLIGSIAFLAFTINKKPHVKKAATTTTLYFKYQLGTYTSGQVSSQGNWQQIEPLEACDQEMDNAACSFSIDVPSASTSLYLNGTHPSSRVLIVPASSGSNNYVADVKENVAPNPSIATSIENVVP